MLWKTSRKKATTGIRVVENNSYQNSEDPDQVAAEKATANTASSTPSSTPTTQSEDPELARRKEIEQEALDKETDEHYNKLFKKHPKDSDKQPRAPGLADELGIEDIYQPLVGGHGKLFCAAGRDAPLVVFEDDFLVLHPAQKPLMDDDAACEEMQVQINERGLLLNELGEVKKITAAKYRGRPIYISGEQRDNTYKHYVLAEDFDGTLHFIFDQDKEGERITADEAYRMRNATFNGELSKFRQLRSTLDEGDESFSPDYNENGPDDVSSAEVG